MKVGFIGLGIMGAPMAGHLIKGRHDLFLNTRTKVPDDLIAAGGTACASAAAGAASPPRPPSSTCSATPRATT